jgi:hypothetical protein
MSRFYFHIITQTRTLADNEGTELADLGEARREAIRDARSLMSAAILDGRDIRNRRIEVRNAEGELLIDLPFSAAFETSD